MRYIVSLVAMLVIAFVLQMDLYSFGAGMCSQSSTLWYSRNWLSQPVTNAVLAFYPSKEHWTVNGDHSERWLVRETTVDDKTWWTIVVRKPT